MSKSKARKVVALKVNKVIGYCSAIWNILSTYLLNTYSYTFMLVLLSAVSRDVSFCGEHQLMHWFITDQSVENKKLLLSLNEASISNPIPTQNSENTIKEGYKKNLRTGAWSMAIQPWTHEISSGMVLGAKQGQVWLVHGWECWVSAVGNKTK